MGSTESEKPNQTHQADYWKFWTGQTISNLGDSFTLFALPLLVFKLSGSALSLAITTTFEFLPFLLFGLIIGAWMDRLDRRRVMILADLLRVLIIGSIPLLAAFNSLTVWWIYFAGFCTSTLKICFDAGQFAAIPNLVSQDDLVAANGRIQASYSTASVIGPLLAGGLIAFMPIQDLLVIDALSFVASALSLALIKVNFNPVKEESKKTSIRQDIVEGLKYVIGHPVLRNISLMMALVNLFSGTTYAQLVFFAKDRLNATDSQVGWLFSAGSMGIVVLSLLASPLRKRWPFSKVALGALIINGLTVTIFAFNGIYWVALLLWAFYLGVGVLFNINTGSLRQAIVPNHLLGRVMSIAGVLALSAIPVGAFIGGLVIEWTGRVDLVYAAIGLIITILPIIFSFTALGQAEQFLPENKKAPIQETGLLSETIDRPK